MKIVKVFLHIAIVLGILKLFAMNGYPVDVLTRIQNLHGKIFIFGFFGCLITFEQTFNTKFKFIPYFFILGTLIEILTYIVYLKHLHIYIKQMTAFLFLCGGIVFSAYSLKNCITLKLSSHYFNFLAGLLLSISSILSKNTRTLLELENVEYFLLFPLFVILGERTMLARIWRKSIFIKIQVVLATLTFILYNITIFILETHGIEKISLLVLIFNSFINDIKMQLTKFTRISEIQRYFRITLNISYIFGIIGVILIIYRRFEPGFHSISLGFIFGMVFSHSVIIFPSIYNKIPQQEKLSYIPFTIFTLANIARVLSSAVIYMGLFSQKIVPIFLIINIASGFLHFISIILLFIMIKSMVKD